MKFDYLKLAKIIKERRKEFGLSTRKLGEVIGISHSEISRFENGLKPNFYFIPFVKMCEELDLDIRELLEEVGLIEEKEERKYLVKITNIDENYFEISAKDEKDAMTIVAKFATENGIIKLDPNKDIELEVEEIEDELLEELESRNVKVCENAPCDTCEYYCPFCDECTFGE